MISVNGVEIPAADIEHEAALFGAGDEAHASAARSLAVRELLRQRACELAIEAEPGASMDDVLDAVLDREITVPEADESECRRYYDQHPAEFASGELVEASHILIAVTDHAPVAILRAKAEETLHMARQHPESFAEFAGLRSNCPSGAQGGSLGQFGRGQMVPEFDAEIFGNADVGVLPRLVKTRHGFHVVHVSRRIAGSLIPFDVVRERIAGYLRDRAQAAAMRQYVHVLAGRAKLGGVDLGAAATPLVR